jgi:nicotinate-nucleotide adenylyltransferase
MATSPPTAEGSQVSAFSGDCLFFGTFNPIHTGHLLLAETAREAFGFRRVIFIPSGQPPHRLTDSSLAPALDRLKMVQLATASHPAFTVWDDEIYSAEPSFTVNTLRQRFTKRFAAPSPDLPAEQRLALIIGRDALEKLHTWYQPDVLAGAVCFLQAPRLDLPLVSEMHYQGQTVSLCTRMIPMDPVGISSTEVRQRVAAGRSIRYRVADPVRQYILANGLYRDRP